MLCDQAPRKVYMIKSINYFRLKMKTCGNSVYVAIADEVVNRRLGLLRNFAQNGQVSASNPLLHIHANRCVQVKQIKFILITP